MATASIEPAVPPPLTSLIASPPTDATHYEVVGGRRVETIRLGARETHLASWLIRLLGRFTDEQKLGHLATEMLFLLDSSTNLQRRPDVAFVSRERWPIDREVPMLAAWDVVPDLAIEVVSLSNSAQEIVAKTNGYFRAGVRLVWVIFPVEVQVQVWESPAACRVFNRDEILDGGPVLPGFRLPLNTLFGTA